MHDDDPTQPIEPVRVPAPADDAAPVPGPSSPEATLAALEPEPVGGAPAAPVPAFAAATPAAAVVAATPQPVPAAAVPASGGLPRLVAGRAGQVIGIVGMVVCIALAVLVLLGRGWAVDQVNSVAATVDENLAKGVPLLASASEKVTGVQDQVTRLNDAASALVGSDNPAPALSAALNERLSGVSERYIELRSTYADARSKITSALERLQALDRLVPGFEIPQGPVDALAALDQRVQELDQSVSAIIGPNGVVESVKLAADRIAQAVDQADELLARVSTGLNEAQAKLAALRGRVASAADTLSGVLTVASVLLFLAFVYLAVLHWILFRAAGGMRKPSASA